MESKKEEVAVFEFQDFANIPELVVPSLCEIWNWQGDTSVLPHKVYSMDYNLIYTVGRSAECCSWKT